jgi:hypothetical protein
VSVPEQNGYLLVQFLFLSILFLPFYFSFSSLLIFFLSFSFYSFFALFSSFPFFFLPAKKFSGTNGPWSALFSTPAPVLDCIGYMQELHSVPSKELDQLQYLENQCVEIQE